MCKFITLIIFLLGPSFFICGIENPLVPDFSAIKDPAELVKSEISRLDTLIAATAKSLEGQNKLRSYICEYQDIHEAYLRHPNDNEILYRMVKSAHKVLETIKQNHLIHTFDTDFLSELTVLSQFSNKKGIPKP